MVNSKLIILLKTFNVVEWRRFGQFLTSPFFNNNKKLLLFYEYLRSIAPKFEKEKLDKQLLFEIIYPKQTYNNGVFEDLIYLLLKNAEKFLTILRLEKKKDTSNLLILEELMERKLDKHYRNYLKKSNLLLDKFKNKDSNFYLYQYQLSDIAKQYFSMQKKRAYDSTLQASLDNLDEFYFFNKLKSSCEMLAWKNVSSIDFKFTFIGEVVVHLLKKKDDLSPVLNTYLSAYHLLINENSENNYFTLKRLLDEYQLIIPDTEKSKLYLFAINYCGLQIKQNNNVYHYGKECLELYIKGVEQKFLYVNGFLTPWTFKNIVKLGFNLKKFDWTADFIKNYHTHLEDIFQKDALHYNMAELNYRQHNYQEAQAHLIQVEYSDIVYNLGAKSMLIKIYFETNEEEALLSIIASFTIYLKRNKKITNNIRQTYLNFTSLLYQLLRAKPPKLPALKEKIETVKLLTARRWLLNICEELQKI